MPRKGLETRQAAVAGVQGGTGGGCVYAGVLVAIAPAVCLKVRVMGV